MSNKRPTKTCYYELLGVESTASSIEIKKGYRKQALIYHPDKNPDNIEEATLKFSEISIAYETLSDPQERSWYDSHKSEVLNGGDDGNGADDYEYYDSSDPMITGVTCDEIMKFMNSSLYTRLDDTPAGLYQIAGKVLSRIANDEVIFARRQGIETKIKYEDDFYEQDIREFGYVETCLKYASSCEKLLYPTFGYSETKYDDLKKFYKKWSNFNTVKTFQWKDEYRINRNYDRRTKRELNKRNEKIRNQFRSEYNKTVKNYINFIKKYDFRMKLGAKREEEQKRQQTLKEFEQLKAYQTQKKQNPNMTDGVDYEEQSWQSIDESKYEELEKTVGSSGKELNAKTEQGLDEQEDVLLLYDCFVCNKNFKSEKQLNNHNNSNAHKKVVKQLQYQMRQQDMELGLDQVSDLEDFESAVEDGDVDSALTEEDDDESENDDLDALQAEIDKLNAELDALDVDDEDDEDSLLDISDSETNMEDIDISDIDVDIDDDVSDYPEDSDIDESIAVNTTEEAKVEVDDKADDDESDIDELSKILNSLNQGNKEKDTLEDDDWDTSNSAKKKSKKKKAKNTVNASPAPKDEQDFTFKPKSSFPSTATIHSPETTCVNCNTVFESRNQLFKHVKATGHVSSPKEVESQKKKSKKNKNQKR